MSRWRVIIPKPTISTLLNIGECTYDYIDNRGKRYVVEGYNEDGTCPTDVCNAICCRLSSLDGKVGAGPCEFLTDSNLCSLHERSIHCKPVSCLVWPTSPKSIEKMNEIAEREGFKERCQLRMVEWQP